MILGLVVALRPGFKITSVDLVSDETGYAIPQHYSRCGQGACSASVTGSRGSEPGMDGVRESWRGAGSGDGDRYAARDREESGAQRPEDLGPGCCEDDEIWMGRVDGLVQFLDRCVRAEVVDAPPVAVQHDAEDHQREIVQLTGWAGEDRARSMPASPTAGQPREPAANDIAGEVFLGDAGRTPMPAIT